MEIYVSNFWYSACYYSSVLAAPPPASVERKIFIMYITGTFLKYYYQMVYKQGPGDRYLLLYLDPTQTRRPRKGGCPKKVQTKLQIPVAGTIFYSEIV